MSKDFWSASIRLLIYHYNRPTATECWPLRFNVLSIRARRFLQGALQYNFTVGSPCRGHSCTFLLSIPRSTNKILVAFSEGHTGNEYSRDQEDSCLMAPGMSAMLQLLSFSPLAARHSYTGFLHSFIQLPNIPG